MHDIVRRHEGAIAEFNPEKSKEIISTLKAAISHAKEMRDWKAGRKAVDWMIEEQKAFVAWWRASVQKGGDRKSKNQTRRPAHLISMSEAEKKTKIKHQLVSRWDKDLKLPDYSSRLFHPSYEEAMAAADGVVRGTGGTGENEWFTPKKYLKLARDVLGKIDLDPASSTEAQKTVKADKHFTKEDSGLEAEWKGRVWLNPPYAQPLISQFVSKLVAEVSAGRVQQAILLTHNYTDTSWFHQAAGISSAICFTRGRIQFYNAQGEIAAPTQGQAFFYFGDNIKKFTQVFSDIGFTVYPKRN